MFFETVTWLIVQNQIPFVCRIKVIRFTANCRLTELSDSMIYCDLTNSLDFKYFETICLFISFKCWTTRKRQNWQGKLTKGTLLCQPTVLFTQNNTLTTVKFQTTACRQHVHVRCTASSKQRSLQTVDPGRTQLLQTMQIRHSWNVKLWITTVPHETCSASSLETSSSEAHEKINHFTLRPS